MGLVRFSDIEFSLLTRKPERHERHRGLIAPIQPEAVAKYRRLLQIDYRGDVARLYCNGQLIADNFYNGRPMLYGLWRLPAGTMELELRILPLHENMPIYFPREADTTPGEQVNNVIITYQGL